MKEAIFAGAMFAIALNWIASAARKPANFVRHFSRGALMLDLNERMAKRLSNCASDKPAPLGNSV